MKKFLLTIFCALFCLYGMAQNEKNYNEPYVVYVNGEVTETANADVTVVDNGDGTINFVLREFSFNIFGQDVYVGDITLENVAVEEEEEGIKTFSKEGTYDLSGQLPAEYQMYASQFKDIPYTLDGAMNDEKLYSVLSIDMSRMQQTIVVVVGSNDFFVLPSASKVYTEPLVVTVNGESSEPQMTDVTVEYNEDGTVNFVLKNFFMNMGGNDVPVGNIIVNDLPVTAGEDGLAHISYDGTIFITEGDLEGVDTWIGPFICQDEEGNPVGIPVVLNGKMNDEKLYVTIDIDLSETINQIVYVQLGTDDFPTPEPEGKVYTEPLVVIVDGNSTEPQDANVLVVDNEDGTINFVLKNFIMSMGDSVLPIGNISVENIATTQGEDGLTHFSYQGDIVIQPGDLPGVAMWYGPYICMDEEQNPIGIPIVLNGKMNDEKLFATIDIEFGGQIVKVQLGTDDFFASVLGDVNGDGVVDGVDAQQIMMYMSVDGYDASCDVNNDNSVDGVDYQQILMIMSAQ